MSISLSHILLIRENQRLLRAVSDSPSLLTLWEQSQEARAMSRLDAENTLLKQLLGED